MKYLSMTLLLIALAGPALADDSDPAVQPPQLLGVWYGTYDLPGEQPPQKAQIWMLVSWQLGHDGWTVAGHNRWNIVEQSADHPHDAGSSGLHAEHFERFKGVIARDRQSVQFTEQTTGRRIHAGLVGTDTMQATFLPPEGDDALFEVRLERIDNGYTPGEAAVTGVDVSHHSGSVDWQKVADAGFRFAYVKSSEGVDNPDAMFETHWAGLKDAGLPRGAYHFYVTEDDPVEQATFFASRIADDPGDLPPAVDVELLGANTTGDMTETLVTFLQTLEEKTGVRPIIYTDSKFWDEHYEPVFGDYGLWMSEYGVHMPKTPFGWETWMFWQHAQNQSVDGVEKNADINLLHPGRRLDALRASPGGDG
jgi:lysozyme